LISVALEAKMSFIFNFKRKSMVPTKSQILYSASHLGDRTGDSAQLELLLISHPRLVKERIDYPEEGYFKNPYLIWFVADNPIRLGELPLIS